MRALPVSVTISERTYVCSECGLVTDRDVNAARNLACVLKKEAVGYTVTGRGHAIRPDSFGGMNEASRLMKSTPNSDGRISI